MIDPELSIVIASVYDAAVDQTKWPAALGRIGDFLGATLVGLTTENLRLRRATMHVTSLDPTDEAGLSLLDDYISTYSKMNPMLTEGFGVQPSGTVHSMADYISEVELRRSRFYIEWLSRRNLLDAICAILNNAPPEITTLAALRDQSHGYRDEVAIERMRLLVPHVARASAISNILLERSTEAATLLDLLDELTASVFLLGEGGRLIHANRSGEAMLRDGDVVRLNVNLLAGSQRSMESVLQAALKGTQANSRLIVPNSATMMTRNADGVLFSATLLPLVSGTRFAQLDEMRAIAALFVKKVNLEVDENSSIVKDYYGLTAREWSVLVAVVNSGDARRAAEGLGLSGHTVRHHLKSIYKKTGAERQIDLSKIITWATSSVI